jgi:hypothetical protein
MQLHLGGHLNYFDKLQRSNLEVALTKEKELMNVLLELEVPIQEIFLVTLNGEVVNLQDAQVHPDDIVQLYPPMGGG